VLDTDTPWWSGFIFALSGTGIEELPLIRGLRAQNWVKPRAFRRAQDDVMPHASTINSGLFVIMLYALSWILPVVVLDGLRTAYLAAGSVWCVLVYLKFRLPVRLCFPVVMALILQLWSLFVSVHASMELGRPLAMGKPAYYLMEALIPFFLAVALVQLDPKNRTRILNIVIAVFGISAAVAWLQFFKVPPFLNLAMHYTYKPIDYWDGTVGLRAVGLTSHPNVLAIQATVGLVAVASKLFAGKVTKWDYALMFFFSGAVVCSQGRAGYAIMAAAWIFVLIHLAKLNWRLTFQMIVVGATCIAIALTFGQNRLGYALQSSSLEEDPSFQFRVNNVWIQLDPIYPKLAMTGIGPSPGLMLGTGPEDKWVPIGRVMESAYRLFLAMYGIPGLILLILALVGSALVAAREVYRERHFPERRQCLAIGFGLAVVVAITAYAGNTVDHLMTLPLIFMITGLAIRSDAEKRTVDRSRGWLPDHMPVHPRTTGTLPGTAQPPPDLVKR
jgi:hypothetical protein